MPDKKQNDNVSRFEIASGGTLVSYKWKDREVETERIPPYVTKIESRAFLGAKAANIEFLGDSIESIGCEAFKDCTRLRSVIFPKTVKSMGAGAFCGCERLEKIDLPGGLGKIDSETFKGCRSLREIDISEGVEDIGEHAFSGTRIRSIRLPKSVTLVSPTAFAEAPDLSEIETDDENEIYKSVDGSLYTRDGRQLVWARRDAERFDVPKGVIRIEPCAFANCKSLVTASIPVGVKSIGLCSFCECTSLEKVDFGDSLEQIGDRAFESCFKLQSVRIPGKVKSVGEEAFKNCVSLSSVEIVPKNQVAGCPIRAYNMPETRTVTPSGVRLDDCVPSVVAASSDMVEIKDEAFSGCVSLGQIVLPASLERIGGGAFFGCSSLGSLVIPWKTSFIGSDAFTGCALVGALQFLDPERWRRRDGKLGYIELDPEILGYPSEAFLYWLKHVRGCDMEKASTAI